MCCSSAVLFIVHVPYLPPPHPHAHTHVLISMLTDWCRVTYDFVPPSDTTVDAAPQRTTRDFDVTNWVWLRPDLGREEAEAVLAREARVGLFIVRASTRTPYVLTVSFPGPSLA